MHSERLAARGLHEVSAGAGRVTIFSGAWLHAPLDEMGFAMRSIAGALSRLAEVEVLVPGNPMTWPDGGFDVTAIGVPRAGGIWPHPDEVTAGGTGRARRLAPPGRSVAAVVETGDEEAHHLAGALLPGLAVVTVGASGASGAGGAGPTDESRGTDGKMLAAVDLASSGADTSEAKDPHAHRRRVHPVGLYARVHPGALDRRHYGLRSVPEYDLVLGDRAGAIQARWPSDRIRWLLARFARQHVVVVEGAEATVWRSRSNVGRFGVHTRMDLWLLMAHARCVVDLLPGALFARESVEALRYGVPVVAPTGSSAAALADAGGALRFSSTAELLECVESLGDPARRRALAGAGRAVADRWYGDPGGLVARLAALLEGLDATGAQSNHAHVATP